MAAIQRSETGRNLDWRRTGCCQGCPGKARHFRGPLPDRRLWRDDTPVSRLAGSTSSRQPYINPKRCEFILFSEPDVCGAEAFAVETGNPLALKTYEDIAKAGVAMATCGGCAEYDYAKKAGVAESNIIVAPDPQSGLKMLQSGRVKVYALGGPVIH